MTAKSSWGSGVETVSRLQGFTQCRFFGGGLGITCRETERRLLGDQASRSKVAFWPLAPVRRTSLRDPHLPVAIFWPTDRYAFYFVEKVDFCRRPKNSSLITTPSPRRCGGPARNY